MRTYKIRWLIGGFVICLLTLVGVVGVTTLRSSSPIPPEVSKQISFAIFYPASNKIVEVDRSTIKYDGKNQLLSYVASTRNGSKLTFSEQATPENFVDAPSIYKTLIERLQGYESFNSPNGTVSLTRPKELNGLPAAVMNSRGTLLFIKAEKDLSSAEWRRIFNDLQQLPQG